MIDDLKNLKSELLEIIENVEENRRKKQFDSNSYWHCNGMLIAYHACLERVTLITDKYSNKIENSI